MTIKNGIYAWFVAATGLSRVIWEDQGAPRPESPYGALKITRLEKYGQDEHRYEYDNTLPAGSDLKDQQSGNRPFTVSCSVYNRPSGNNSLAHNETGMHYISLALSSLANTALLQDLCDAGAAYLRNEPALDTSVAINGRFVSQATFEVHFLAVENFDADPASWIKTTKVSGTFEDQAGTSLDFTDEVMGDLS